MAATRPGIRVGTSVGRPLVRDDVVVRRRLLRRLDGGLDAGAINVSAGAGYGKTTLLASWAAELERTVGVAWLTIRPWHNDPTVFAEDLGGQLSGAGLLSTADMARPVLSDLVAGLHDREPTRGVVILDDVHVLRDSSIYQALSELLQDTPRGLCLVVSGREDAPLPWGTRRTRRGLVEIREPDLVFDDDETGRLLALPWACPQPIPV